MTGFFKCQVSLKMRDYILANTLLSSPSREIDSASI